MGDRREQRVAQAFRLHLHHRSLRNLHIVNPPQRDRDLPQGRAAASAQGSAASRLRRGQRVSTPRTRMGAFSGTRQGWAARVEVARPASHAVPSSPRWRQTPRELLAGISSSSWASVTSTRASPLKSRCTAAAPSSATWLLTSAADSSGEFEKRRGATFPA